MIHVLSVHYIMIFWTLFDPPSPFRNVFLVTLTTASKSPLNLWISPPKKKKNFFFFLEIYKINLGRTCFDRVGRKSETNNIFF